MRSEMSMKHIAIVVIAGLLMVGVAPSASAQVTTGTITGAVRDAQGGTVPGATAELTSIERGTSVPSVTTDSTGAFVFVNVAPDSYRLRISLAGFRTLVRDGVAVSPGDRIVLPALTLEIGGAAETVTVVSEVGLIQAQSGERSFTVGTDAVANLPTASRSFTALATLAPGVTVDANNTPTRVGGGGSTNIIMDGVSANDTGSNRPLMQMNVESIAEVKIMTSGYQAEFGRASGVQVMAVTKGGTNRFSGSVYDVERDSDWNANSKTSIVNGDPKAVTKERDWGFTIGGPIGRPGGTNKLFFFFAQEVLPRTAGGDVQRFRMPTALERAGDFSESTDQNGVLYNLIKDPLSTTACSATVRTGCFQDGGVLGRIPADRLYQPGMNILRMYPQPTLTGAAAAGLNYNYEVTRPVEKTTGFQPAIRVDYQPTSSLRGTFKYSGWRQQNQVFNGLIPGFDDAKQFRPAIFTLAATVNYTITPTTFLEATWGRSKNELTGCALGQSGTGPIFCRTAVAMAPVSDRATAGLSALPTLFPDAVVVDPGYYSYQAFSSIAPPFFNNGRIDRVPSFTWAGRVANSPPNVPYPTFLNLNDTQDVSMSVTRVQGRHTMKTGLFYTRALKTQGPNGQAAVFGTISFTNDTSNTFDTTFPFANAAVGVFNSFNQRSRFAELNMVYRNIEAYLQDNWKITPRLTLDVGMRFVHQQPAYDDRLAAATFLPERYSVAGSPAFYTAACSNGSVTCTGTTRVARNPLTGTLLPAGSAVSIGTRVPNTGDPLNGILAAGQGVEETLYTWPTLGVSPRIGAAYDLTGTQRMVLRGGAGVYFDRPNTNAVLTQGTNPPFMSDVTLRYAQLQNMAASNITVLGAPTLGVFQHDLGLPTSVQWNAGLQMALPWASSLDVSYVGQHAWNQVVGVNINAIDFGSSYLEVNRDPTLTSTVPGGTAVPNDLMRGIRGYGAITQQQDYGWNTFHSFQLSYQRRFSKGIAFGVNETVALRNVANTAARLEHAADGSFRFRADQSDADDLLQVDPIRHTLKANFVWDLPDLQADGGAVRRALAYAANDWQLSGIWTGTSAAPYTVGFAYTGIGNTNLTGSNDYVARIALTGTDPGSGCSADPLRQFTTAAFAGPQANSVGLESSPNVVKGCFQSAFDLAIARTIRLGGRRTVQVRFDVLNAPNQAIVTARNATMNLASLATSATATNLPFDAAGDPIASRSQPKNAGFGVVTGYQSPRTVQMQIRFGF